jgi:2-oxoglutarate dehydrogenase E2 component (dihydrolipoamide succinyltransferase)
MAIDVQIPPLGESVSEGVIVRWIKTEGETVDTDEPLFELETDKASIEIPAPGSGVVHVLQREGSTVQVGDVVARIDPDGARTALGSNETAATAPPPTADQTVVAEPTDEETTRTGPLSPAVRRLVEENSLDPSQIRASGKAGRLTKADVLAHLQIREDTPPSPPRAAPREPTPYPPVSRRADSDVDVERVPMSRLRRRIADRLLQAQRQAAILTTFNEIDMSAVLDLRSRYKESFAEKHGVSLGFLSFFVRACTAAANDVPIVNAQIDGSDILHHKHMNLGIAVGTERGLVVPILHRADELSFAEIEKGIGRLAKLARDNKLAIADLSGGTFTISNGGIYGSLLSTPILNPPQSAILGMHKIEKRPVVVDDEIAIRPMMYVALSYDHRLIDGAEAVTFLVRVKERIEDPERLLLEI